MRILTRWGLAAVWAAVLLGAAVSTAAAQTGTFTDSRDGKKYKTITVVGTKWMAENLNYQTSSGSWCYDNNSANCAKYGRLYDFHTAKTACPAGWGLPSLLTMQIFWEFGVEIPQVPVVEEDLFILVGAGKKLKARSGWDGPNGTDNVGFSGLPGGQRKPDGSFKSIGSAGTWWIGYELGDNAGVFTLLSSTGDDGGTAADSKRFGYSVRCVELGGNKQPAQQGGGAGTFTDSRDGKTYRAVVIGGKRWMGENLNYQTASGSWCYDDNNSNCDKYGRLYDWKTAKTVCPKGFHLPSRNNWDNLGRAAGGARKADNKGNIDWHDAGKKLKTKSGWGNRSDGSVGNGTDDFGFSALPGGRHHSSGSFYDAGSGGNWWTATENDANHAYYRVMGYNDDNVYENSYYDKSQGYSVRCVADN